MSQSVYIDAKRQYTTALSPEAITAALKAHEGLLWVDISRDDPDAEGMLRNVFAFHPLAIEDSLNERTETPKVDDYRDYLFIVAQSVRYASRTDQLELLEVNLFLGANYVVTVHRGVSPIDELFARATEGSSFLDRGADFLTHTILDSLVDLLLPAVEEMDEHIDELEARILENPQRELLPEVLLLKRNTLRLRRSILPERDMVNRLSRGEFPDLIRPDALIFYRDVYDHIVRVEEMLEGLRDLADGALSSYLSSVNNRMNEVMKAMSVVAVIFLPLTLIASIYGTNLNLSPFGLTFKYGFELMLISMIVSAIGLLVYFRKRGWF